MRGTEIISGMNKRITALENNATDQQNTIPTIVKLYSTLKSYTPAQCGDGTECGDGTVTAGGKAGTIADFIASVNYAAVGEGTEPSIGDTGIVDEVQRKPIINIDDVDGTIILDAYFEENDANANLTNAAVLYKGTVSANTGTVVAGAAINETKTTAKTLTVSAEITIIEEAL